MYPGRADARKGDPAEFRIETASHDRTSPAELTVAAGTEVRWINRTTAAAFVRFEDPVPEVCLAPHRFARTRDAGTLASEWLAPFEEARLCIAAPGRYRFVATLAGVRSAEAEPARYGTLIVAPGGARASP
ncbi:MAG TPA: hypothetical protein VF406_02415 [Thermodesulfobacteriota bacterium]